MTIWLFDALSQIVRGAVVARTEVGILLSSLIVGVLSVWVAFVVGMLVVLSGFGELFSDLTGGQVIVYGGAAVFPFMAVFYLYAVGDGVEDNDQ